MREYKLKISNSSHFQILKTVVTLSPAVKGFCEFMELCNLICGLEQIWFLQPRAPEPFRVLFEAHRCATICGLTVEAAPIVPTLPAKPANPLTPSLLHTDYPCSPIHSFHFIVHTFVWSSQHLKTSEGESRLIECICLQVLDPRHMCSFMLHTMSMFICLLVLLLVGRWR